MFRVLKILHQIAGLLGSLLVLMMAITGLLLNHRSLIGYSTETAMKLQKLLFALHSGTIENISMVWLTDVGALCMIVLSMTGVWIWATMVIRRTGKHKEVKNEQENS